MKERKQKKACCKSCVMGEKCETGKGMYNLGYKAAGMYNLGYKAAGMYNVGYKSTGGTLPRNLNLGYKL